MHTHEAGTATTTHSNERKDVVLMIWGVLSSRYKHTWTSGHPTPNSPAYALALNEWCEDIAGLRRSDVTRALEASRQDPRFKTFPPNSMEFRALCINDDDEKEALFQEVTHWSELDQENKSRKALFIVQKLDYTNFRRADLKTAKKMFDSAYHKLLKHLSEGNELPEFVLEIEYEAPPPMPKEQLSSFLGNLINSI